MRLAKLIKILKQDAETKFHRAVEKYFREHNAWDKLTKAKQEALKNKVKALAN
jgi:hypothetical protein